MPAPPPILRLFIAFDTPPAIKRSIGEIRDTLHRSNAEVKWESDDKFHCTIKFLGDTSADIIPPLSDALDRISRSSQSFSASYGSVGRFPPKGKGDPRVIWVGIRNPDGLLDLLSRSLDDVLAPLGFEREKRAFHPHVTLGRVKGRKNLTKLLGIMESITFESPLVPINRFQLVRSELRPAGSVYTVLRAFDLR